MVVMAEHSKSTRAPADWDGFRQWMAWAHPKGAEVVDQARRRRCSLKQLMVVTVSGHEVQGGYPILQFKTRTGYRIVQPGRMGVYTRVGRGTGPTVDLGGSHGR
jgi:hypothetical protein